MFDSEERFKDIEHNISVIKGRIAAAAERSNRKAEDVRLMAVTKTVEPIFINHAIECGIDLIGENKVQELESKREYLSLDGVDVHIIGHLQTNKVRKIIGKVQMIQSVDSLRLAKEISRQCEIKGETVDVLVEVNVGAEEGKTGVPFEIAKEFALEVSKLPGITVKGLMAIPPMCPEEELREYFKKMNTLFIDISAQNVNNDNMDMSILSMGMSGDYELAVECGANLVRVGSSIFGPRLY